MFRWVSGAFQGFSRYLMGVSGSLKGVLGGFRGTKSVSELFHEVSGENSESYRTVSVGLRGFMSDPRVSTSFSSVTEVSNVFLGIAASGQMAIFPR